MFKHIWHFQQNPSIFFNEVYYNVGVDIYNAAWYGPNSALISRRVELLDDSATLVKATVINMDSPGQALIRTLNREGEWDAVSNLPAYHHDAAIVLSLVSSAGAKRKLWMRGTSTGQILRRPTTNRPVLYPAANDAVKAFIRELTTTDKQWYILARHRNGSTLAPRHIIESVVSTGDGYATVTFVDNLYPIAFQPSTKVVFNGVNQKLLPGLKGEFLPVSGTQDSVKIRYVTPRVETVTGSIGGYAYLLQYRTDTAIDSGAFAYAGTRRSKNVDTGSRGARPGRRDRV